MSDIGPANPAKPAKPAKPADPHDQLNIWIDGVSYQVDAGISVAAALINCGQRTTRRSPSGQLRFAVCGMGVCQECRVTIDRRPQQLACQVLCAEQMRIDTDLGATERN